MAALKEEHKLLIVQALACFDTPTQVVEAVKEEFGIEITRQQVARYDPTKAAGVDVSKKLRAVFEETRRTFLEDTSSIPIAQQSFRLRALQRLYEKALKSGNVRFAEISIMYSSRLGEIKLNPWRDGFYNLWFLVKKRFS